MKYYRQNKNYLIQSYEHLYTYVHITRGRISPIGSMDQEMRCILKDPDGVRCVGRGSVGSASECMNQSSRSQK